MAIINRKGQFVDFDPSKMLPGEWAVVLDGDSNSKDGKSIYMCFSAGVVKRMATYEDMIDNVNNATEDVQNMFTEEMRDAINQALEIVDSGNAVITNAQSVLQSAEQATKNANDAAEEAKSYVLGDISSKTVTFSEASSRVNIASDESTATLFGKIKKFFTDLKPHAFTAPVQNLTTNVAGSALDATMGATIQGLINAKVNNTMTVLPEGGNPQGSATAVGFYTINNPLNMNISGWFNFIIMRSNNDANSRCIVGLYQDRLYYSWRNSDTGLWSEWFIVQNTGKLSDLNTTNKNSVVDAVNEVLSRMQGTTFPLTLASGFTEKYVSAKKKSDGIIIINFSLTGSGAANAHTLLATIPVEYRPAGQIITTGHTGLNGPIQVIAETDGSIKAWGTTAYTAPRGTIVYTI